MRNVGATFRDQPIGEREMHDKRRNHAIRDHTYAANPNLSFHNFRINLMNKNMQHVNKAMP